MITVVSWNIGTREKPWHALVQMARDGDADVALLQEAGSPPGDVGHLIEHKDRVFWNRHSYDSWPLVVTLSDRVRIETYRQVEPISELAENAIGVSGIGTIAAARVVPCESEEDAFVAASMYARWLKPHPSTKSRWSVGCSDASAHRIMSDLSAFIGHPDPTEQRHLPATHRILAAGDLNMFYGATGSLRFKKLRPSAPWPDFVKISGPLQLRNGLNGAPPPAETAQHPPSGVGDHSRIDGGAAYVRSSDDEKS